MYEETGAGELSAKMPFYCEGCRPAKTANTTTASHLISIIFKIAVFPHSALARAFQHVSLDQRARP
jgi:hypothetical protein